MPYVTSVERLALKKGRAEGRVEGRAEGKAEMLLKFLPRHYAIALPADLEAKIRSTSDPDQLERWADLVFEANSLEEFRRMAQI